MLNNKFHREKKLSVIKKRLEVWKTLLSFLWLLLIIIDTTSGLSLLLNCIFFGVWIFFILEFFLEFSIAPDKKGYLWENWLTALSLAIPALRIFRIFRVLVFLRLLSINRAIQLLQLLFSLRGGMISLGKFLNRRGVRFTAILFGEGKA